MEADGLTAGKFERFDSAKRVPVVWKELDFKVLDELMKPAEELF